MPKLPKFKSEEEFAEFVDTHDTAPYWRDMKPVDASRFGIKRRSKTAVRVPVSQVTLRKLRALAAQRGVPVDDLLREWMVERVKKERIAA